MPLHVVCRFQGLYKGEAAEIFQLSRALSAKARAPLISLRVQVLAEVDLVSRLIKGINPKP